MKKTKNPEVKPRRRPSRIPAAKPLGRQRRSFEAWMGRYWSGVILIYLPDINEYGGLAQAAWEVWQKLDVIGTKGN